MKLTEQIEAKAMEVHSKEIKLKEKKLLMIDTKQEILEKINVVKADIEYVQKAQHSAKICREKLIDRLRILKKKRQERIDHLREEAQRLEEEQIKERLRIRALESSCPKTKIRTYQCNEDGFRLIKQFSYKYDI